jgi:hypothetical protein
MRVFLYYLLHALATDAQTPSHPVVKHSPSPAHGSASKTFRVFSKPLNYSYLALQSAVRGKYWRWVQSGANRSPPEFPLTGKDTGIFREFDSKLLGRNGENRLNMGNLSLTFLKQGLHKTGN